MTTVIGGDTQRAAGQDTQASVTALPLVLTCLPAPVAQLSNSFLDVSSTASWGRTCKHFQVVVLNDPSFLFIRIFFNANRLHVGPVLNGVPTNFQVLLRAQRERFLSDWYDAGNATRNLSLEHALLKSRERFILKDADSILDTHSLEKLKDKNVSNTGALGVGHLFARSRSLLSFTATPHTEPAVDVNAVVKRWIAFAQELTLLSIAEAKKLEEYAAHVLSFKEALGAEKVIQKWALLLDEFMKLFNSGTTPSKQRIEALAQLSAWKEEDTPATCLENLISLFNSINASSEKRLAHELSQALPQKIATARLLVYETLQTIRTKQLETLVREYFQDYLPKSRDVLVFYKNKEEVTAEGAAWILCHIGFLRNAKKSSSS